MSGVTCWVRPLRSGGVELFARTTGGATLGVSGSWTTAIGLLDHFEGQHGVVGRPTIRAQRGRRDEAWERHMAWAAECVDQRWGGGAGVSGMALPGR